MSRRKKQSLFSRFRAWLNGVPHLFAKATVLWCVGCGSAASFYALRIMDTTGSDPASLLGVILAFFGGELVILGARQIFKEK